jgi:hypothetical protein
VGNQGDWNWRGITECKGEAGNRPDVRPWLENLIERDRLWDEGIDERKILKWRLRKWAVKT